MGWHRRLIREEFAASPEKSARSTLIAALCLIPLHLHLIHRHEARLKLHDTLHTVLINSTTHASITDL